MLGRRVASSFRSENIGYLTEPVRIDERIVAFQSHYASCLTWTPVNDGGQSAARETYEIEMQLAVIDGQSLNS